MVRKHSCQRFPYKCNCLLFARYLQEVLEVPVGIIISSLGGSKVEAWMSREAITPFKSIDLSILNNNEPIKTLQLLHVYFTIAK